MASPTVLVSRESPPTVSSPVMTGEESSPEGKESLQGPHDWRKRLKPISRDSSMDEHGSDEGEEAADGGDSPREKRQTKGDDNTNPHDDKVEERVKNHIKNMPVWKKELVSKRIKGPPGGGAHPGHRRRHQMHAHTESAFTRQVVNKPSSPGMSRRKLHMAPHMNGQPTPRTGGPSAWDKKPGVQSMVAGGRRGAAHTVTPESNGAAAKKRVEKVLKARLYLLQQSGPNSFLIGGDSPDHKYRVVIGPQRCSCGRGAYCVHIMFVMLRVFQITENDPTLWSKTLKNYEVETLFRTFHERRSSLIENLSKRKKKALKQEVEEESKSSDCSSVTTPSTDLTDETETKDEHDEEDTCPICLLEMVEGESLTECVNGCQNKLHHHCIAVWFEECRRQNEPLICPLCRATWKVDQENGESSTGAVLPVPPNTRVSSPSHDHHVQGEAEVMLPHAEPIPTEHQDTAAPWIPVLGEELVSCLFSKNWMVREIAIKQLGRVAVGALLLGVGEGRAGVVLSADRQATTRQMLEICCSVLAYVCADPVYKVFVATLRTLRTVLAYTPCRDEVQQTRLKALMVPVIDGILWKCADSNKRTSQLSMSAMQELIRGQEGELSVGREIAHPGEIGLGGLPYLLSCVTQDYNPASVQYQWLLGRLSFLHKLLDEHTTDFLLKAPQSDLTDKQCPLEEYQNYNRVMQALRFTRGALENPHQNVARTARHVFYQIARLQSHNAAALKHVTDLLDTLGLNIQVQLKRKLLARMTTDFHFTQRSSKWLEAEEAAQSNADSLAATNSSQGSEHSSPRCGSPQAAATATPPRISVTVNNFVSGNLNFVPMAPPNSPERRRGPEGRSRSGTETDSPASGATSSVVSSETMDGPDGGEHLYNHHGLYASTPRRDRTNHPTKVDVSVSTSPTLAIRGINFNLSTSIGESSTDDFTEINGVTMTIDGHDQEELAVAISSEDDACMTQTMTTEVTSVGVDTDVEQEAVHNTTLDSAVQTVSTHPSVGGGIDTASTVSSTDATAASGSSTGMLSEDLSDPTVSPSGADYHVSFKTEVASNSPNNTPARRAPIVVQPPLGDKDSCHCKEEVEREEAQALVAAMEQSEFQQNPLPYIPGLSQDTANNSITIRVQDEPERPNGERVILDPLQSSSASGSKDEGEYREGVHWARGPMLGTGAFSTCYQARDMKTGTLVAVKQISFCRNSVSEQEEVVDAVREEIQMMSRLNHPNVIRILGATQQACHFFMFVEWMPGGSVAYLLDRYGAFSEYVIIRYTQQVLRGIAYLHDMHVLHRDLKGANLLVDSTGERVRIADFGASARLSSRHTAAGEFQGQLLGTIAFMAPEVLRGESYGRSCDVWSVGCTMIEMATTKPPWGAGDLSNHLALIFKIASSENPPPIPDNLSPPVRDLLRRCLECGREDRPPAKELLKHPLFTLLQKT